MIAQAPQIARSPIAGWLSEPPQPANVARLGYIICATPRSGSYFLCDLLRSTGVLGRPHEFFCGEAMRRHGAPDYPDDPDRQIAAVRTYGCSANGIFGVKLLPSHLAGRSLSRIMTGLDGPVPVLLEREDLLGQAISQARAAQLHWFISNDEPRFDAGLIRDHLDLLVRSNASWRIYFARRGIVPLRLIYEDVVASPQDAVVKIAAAMGLDAPPQSDPQRLSMTVQRDAISAEWRERFLAAQPSALELRAPRTLPTITWQRRLRRLARVLHFRSS
jgi:LPS sulfotransferase NodH